MMESHIFHPSLINYFTLNHSSKYANIAVDAMLPFPRVFSLDILSERLDSPLTQQYELISL